MNWFKISLNRSVQFSCVLWSHWHCFALVNCLPISVSFCLLFLKQRLVSMYTLLLRKLLVLTSVQTWLLYFWIQQSIFRNLMLEHSIDHNEIQVPLQESCATQDNVGVNSWQNMHIYIYIYFCVWAQINHHVYTILLDLKPVEARSMLQSVFSASWNHECC